MMTEAGIEIRTAKTVDITRVANMVERYWAFEGISGFDNESVARQPNRVSGDRELGSVIVASEGEQLIGYLIVVYAFSLEHLGLTAEIYELYVEPD